MSRPVTNVAVVGRDAAVWTTALGLQRAFGRTGVEVRVVELPSLLAPADVYVALPTLAGLHRLLGIDDGDVLAACAGVPVLGQRFSNWSGAGDPFLHAYDTQPVGLNNVDLLQYWVKARSEGLALAFDAFSLGASMARHGKAVRNGDVVDGFSRPAHGYHLDARSYVSFLRRRAQQTGVRTAAALVDARVRDEQVEGLELADGTTLQADLYVDASGADAVLIGRLAGDSFISWREQLPCNRILAASAKRLDPLPAFSQVSAYRPGWIGLYPLQDRTAVVSVYDGSLVTDREAIDRVGLLTGLRFEGDATVAAFEAGLRPRPWIGNCVAVGEGAVSLEPLDAVQPQVIQLGLSQLVALFPVDAGAMPEAELYNAAVASHARNIRDFQAAHYRLNQRRDEPFWDRARAVEPSPELAWKMRLFGARGRVALYDDETFQEANWASIFIGHGLIPKDFDPRVDMLGRDEQVQQMQHMLSFIAAEVREAPSLAEQLSGAGGRG